MLSKRASLINGIIYAFCFGLLVTGCINGPYLWVQELPTPKAREHSLQPGDVISLQVLGHEKLNGELPIRLDGSLGVPLVGAVPAQGRSLASLADNIQESLKRVIENPKVYVSLVSMAKINIGVIGEVQSSGYYLVQSNQGILPLLARAGGLTEYAHENRIFVVRAQATTPRIRFRMNDLKKPNTAASRFLLMDGDTIIVE